MDLTKEYQTKCGYAVEGLRKDGASGYVGFVRLPGIRLAAVEWRSDMTCTHRGRYSHDHSNLDLIEKPRTVRVKGWLNVYEDGQFFEYVSRKAADASASKERIACIPIDQDVAYGEGLNDE